ncbi:MAG: hypothetical protein ABL966_03275 [Acidimicrobiales bacterium]
MARRVRNGSLAALAVVAMATLVSPDVQAAPIPGSAGTDTSLPDTDSAVTVQGRGQFADLRITVNQTEDLVNQAISITWSGGTPTSTGTTRYEGHYLQIMQCWGDDDGLVPGSPGPPPEQCVQGATDGVYGGRSSALFGSGNNTLTRVISRRDLATYDPADGYLDARTGAVWRPFRAVDGTLVDVHHDPDFNPVLQGGNYWLNPYFNVITTNEIAGGRTRPDGTGEELFEVTTGVESTGLGCGQKVQPVAGGGTRTPRCWLVIVPRGDPADENQGVLQDPSSYSVATSPLSKRAWQNRIAVPLDFNPVDTPCELSDEQRRLGGTELVVAAISSWQPSLCANRDLSPYAYGTISDATARQQLLSNVPGSPGMVVVSRPYDPSTLDPANPVVYAPLTISGTVIGFNLERNPKPGLSAEEDELRGIRVAELNLTPRLVAKLLTQSYRLQPSIKFVAPDYPWMVGNPAHLTVDPDFLRFNPEFELLNTGGKNVAGLVLPARSSDAARQVWEWVLADPEARAWLDGTPDEWGTRVNPVYATTAAANPSGLPFASPVPESYPKSDPHCYQGPPQGPGGAVVPPPLCGTDWIPYAQSLRDTARLTRAADDAAKTNEDVFAETAERVYRADGPQILGSRAMMSLTDSASAFQYGVQTARLSRAGDGGPDRRFVAPDAAGLLAGVSSMKPGADPAVLEPDPGADAPAAYPLTALTYAAIAPLSQDATARAEYAAFVDYAAGPGQVVGREVGQLPAGYAPLTASLKAQATAAARTIREMAAAPAAPSPTLPLAPVDGFGDFDGAPSSPGGSAGALDPLVPPRAAPDDAVDPDPSPGAGLATPILALASNRLVLPGLGVIALLSALGALEITKRPRRPAGGGA